MTLARSEYIVLDTNVVSLFLRGREQADYYRARIAGLRPAISFQTLEELWHGAYNANWGETRREAQSVFLEQYEVIWPDRDLVLICARLRAERKRAGRELGMADAWIAATALMLNCPLATADRDFAGIPDLKLVQG